MKNKPNPTDPQFVAPGHLSAASQKLWASVVPGRCASPERLAYLTVALEARDRADQCSELIAAEGLISTTKRSGVAHVHPATKLERENRQLFLKAWATLGLNFNHNTDNAGLAPLYR